jgi:hypothetical protein
MTYRKRVIKSIIRFQSLKENGTTKLLETKHDRKHEYLKRVLILKVNQKF